MKNLIMSAVLIFAGHVILAQNEYKTEMKNNAKSSVASVSERGFLDGLGGTTGFGVDAADEAAEVDGVIGTTVLNKRRGCASVASCGLS